MLATVVIIFAFLNTSSGSKYIDTMIYEACCTCQNESFVTVDSRLDDVLRVLAQLSSSVTRVSNRQQELSVQLDSIAARLDSAVPSPDSDSDSAVGPPRQDGLLERLTEQHRDLVERLDGVAEQVRNLSASCSAERAEPRQLGSPCRQDADCAIDVALSFCSEGVCVCSEGTSEDAGQCRRQSQISEPCERDADCAHHHALCSGGVCACGAGFGGDNCRPLVAAGASCSADSECHPSRPVLSCLLGRCAEPFCELTAAGGRRVRLAGHSTSPTDCRAGRLVVTDAGRWWQLCDASPWTDADAAVACRELGFPIGSAVIDGRYGDGRTGPARVLSIRCSGAERTLSECPQRFVTNGGSGGCPADSAPVTIECWDK
ncbi:Galectin-3-binding protein A [Amphibalanus amphitrite]|uniref:Galectin-3-binding protein A n=1 Tax=Amphibalanus amphitrite TaxID=1232801 RepID=A0A6A4VBV8_AMPAM|nr:Galectin-3-binding protein A [Amphibalanus amphitrite]